MMILVQISASVSGVTVVCMAISETGCQDHGTIKLSNMGHWGPFTLPRYQSAGGPVRSLLPFRVLNAFRLHRGGHKAKGISGKWVLNALRLHRGGHKAKVGSGRSTPCGFTEVGISCLLPFTFCLSGCPRRHGRRTRAEADPQCAHDGYRRGTTLPAQALPAMRLVLLQSAIQNPKSRIQNRVSALRRSSLGHGHGQAIEARMHGSAPSKTEETIVGLPRLLVLSVFSRFGGCHLSTSGYTTR